MPPKIDHTKCRLCGVCIYQCGKHVFSVDGGVARMKAGGSRRCVDCFICDMYCPAGAITVKIARKRNEAHAGAN